MILFFSANCLDYFMYFEKKIVLTSFLVDSIIFEKKIPKIPKTKNFTINNMHIWVGFLLQMEHIFNKYPSLDW